MTKDSLEDLDQGSDLPLLYEHDNNASQSFGREAALAERRRASHKMLIYISALLNVVLFACVVVLAMRLKHSIPWIGPRPPYSPADHVVTYENIVYPPTEESTIYHGPPSPAVDAAWEALYQKGISALPKEEAERMTNWTVHYPGDEEHYITTLDVFHQLHCLNWLRKFFWPEYYPNAGELRLQNLTYDDGSSWMFDHADHCLNMIRENLMCTADLTPNVWRWNKHRNVTEVRWDVVHSCKSWDAIQDWAEENSNTVAFDPHAHALGDHHSHEE